MALICRSFDFIIFKNNLINVLTNQSINRLSQWTPQFVEPVLDLNQLKESEDNKEFIELAFKPIKARYSSRTSSLFYDHLLNRFIDNVQRKGHRALARDLMRQTFCIIKRTQIDKLMSGRDDDDHKLDIECDPLKIFHTALDNCRPLILNRPIKRGGATYQVPYPLKEKESEELAMRWIISAVKERPKPRKTFFPEAMAKELIDAYYNEGKVVKKKQDVHRVCEANKAYAHYRWG